MTIIDPVGITDAELDEMIARSRSRQQPEQSSQSAMIIIPTFGAAPVGTAFVTADGDTWRKIEPQINKQRKTAPPCNAVNEYRKASRGWAIYGHFCDDFDQFRLVSAVTGKAKQVAA